MNHLPLSCVKYIITTFKLAVIMRKFEFSPKQIEIESIFNGQEFYNLYKDAEFLRHSDNVETLLSKGYELSNMLKGVNPGERVALGGMMLERNTPLYVRRTGPNVYIEDFEFTHNRLSGLVAAFAFDNRQRFPILSSHQAQLLGLTWNNEDDNKCILFLSAVSGTEHFYEQFKYWPLVCALRKLQLNKITKEPVIKMAKIKNEHGLTMAQDMMKNIEVVKNLWKEFPGSSCNDLVKQLELCPPELKMLFKNIH